MINGWQQIKDNNDKKSVGTQLEFKPNAKHTINWNTYIGDERSTTAPQNRMRYFSDIFWLYNLDGKWSMTSCIYLGKQEQLKGNLKIATIGGRLMPFSGIDSMMSGQFQAD